MKTNENFTKFAIEGLKKHYEQNNVLGDRSQYVGASDIGQCPRKCFLSKTTKVDLKKRELLAFARGHASEEKFKKSFEAQNISFDSQLEVQGKKLEWLKVHPDFLLKYKTEDVVVECKDSKSIPNEPYESWVLQLQIQMGVLIENGYNVKRGMILVTGALEEDIKAFEADFDPTLYELALKRAEKIWTSLQNKTEPEAEHSMLCQYCPFMDNCPKVQQSKVEGTLPDDLLVLAKELKNFPTIEKKTKAIRTELIQYLEAMGMRTAKAGEYIVSLNWYQGREKVDTSKIPPEILENAKTKGDPYPVLKIS